MCRKPVTAHGVCLLREFQEGGWRLSPTFVIMGFASADSDHVVPGLPRACKMTDHELLEQIDIPVACPQDWWRMRGDERTRHCKLCGKNVHNLAAMTRQKWWHSSRRMVASSVAVSLEERTALLSPQIAAGGPASRVPDSSTSRI